MISIGSMMSLNDSYYFDDNDDDMEIAPSPRFHRRNISQGNMKVQGTITKITIIISTCTYKYYNNKC